MKEIEKIILAYPNLNWDWDTLMYEVSLEFIFNNPQFNWDYYHIHRRDDNDAKILIENYHLINEQDWMDLTYHECFTIKDIEEHSDLHSVKGNHEGGFDPHSGIPWKYSYIGFNPNVTMKDLDKYSNFITQVDWNKNITFEYVKDNYNRFMWQFDDEEFYESLSYSDVEYFLHKLDPPINTIIRLVKHTSLSSNELVRLLGGYQELGSLLVHNENITEEYIFECIGDNKLGFGTLSQKIKDLSIVKNNPDLPWHYYSMSMNRHITLQDIKEIGIDKNWDWAYLTSYLQPLNDIEDNPDLPWRYKHIIYRNDLTLDLIKKYQNNIVLERKHRIEIPVEIIGKNMTIEEVEELIQMDIIDVDKYSVLSHPDITLEFFNRNIDFFGNMYEPEPTLIYSDDESDSE